MLLTCFWSSHSGFTEVCFSDNKFLATAASEHVRKANHKGLVLVLVGMQLDNEAHFEVAVSPSMSCLPKAVSWLAAECYRGVILCAWRCDFAKNNRIVNALVTRNETSVQLSMGLEHHLFKIQGAVMHTS